MSVLSGMYDNLPVRRALHAPDRPWSAMDRTPLPSSVGREGAEGVARHGPITAVVVPTGPALRGRRQAFGAVSARAARGFVCTYPRFGTCRLSNGPVANIFRAKRSADAGLAVARVRTKGSGTRNQRSDDPTSDPSWLRSGRG